MVLCLRRSFRQAAPASPLALKVSLPLGRHTVQNHGTARTQDNGARNMSEGSVARVELDTPLRPHTTGWVIPIRTRGIITLLVLSHKPETGVVCASAAYLLLLCTMHVALALASC